MRIEFKKKNIKKSKFFRFCEENGADYFEDNCGVWYMPKKKGVVSAALKLEEKGKVVFGEINEECMNFESISDTTYFKVEQEWIIKTLTLFQKYRR